MTAREFHDTMAIGYFKAIYPIIARNILARCPVQRGVCADIGGGSAVLGAELARLTQMQIISIDSDPMCLEIAREYLLNEQLSHRVTPIIGQAEKIPLEDQSVNLVVSRGSVFFWEDKVKGMNEIYRILKPGGYAYIGGGMGSVQLKREIFETLHDHEQWKVNRSNCFRKNLPIHLNLMMRQTNIPSWIMLSSEEGTWILFQKEK